MDNTTAKIQCGCCSRFFAGVTIFDMHRKGEFANSTRRCMADEEMHAAGMDSEVKNIRLLHEGKEHFEEHPVWFHVAKREKARAYFKA